MNDTILNSRQRQILKLLKEKRGLSRLELSRSTVFKKETSKITVIRDLNELIKSGFITSSGKGRATRYGLVRINPLLEYIDMDNYFETDSDRRKIKSDFNHHVYGRLSNLYSRQEIDWWEKGSKMFKEGREKLDPSIYQRELERFVIELSWKSSQIEGNTYSLIEAETLIKQNIRAQGRTEAEAVMILNHRDAFETILDKRAAHSLSDKHELENTLRQLIKHANRIKYPPEKAIILAAMIAYLQPFADGNKRTARMLANAVLIGYDYLPLSYRNVDVNEYRSAMIIFYETNNLHNFKRIFISQLEFAMKNYFQK